MDPLEILVSAIRYPPAPGGAETHAHEVAKELVRRGHQVTVYTSDLRKEHPFEHLEEPFDLVEDVPVRRKRAYTLGEALHYPFMPGELGMLRAPADIMHSHSFGYFHTNISAVRRKLRGTPLVITPHYHPPESMQGGWARHQLRSLYDTQIADWVFDQADAIIAVSRAELSSMAHHISDLDKVRVIPNGIDTTRFEDLPSGDDFRAARDIEGDMILYVGRLAQNKRMELVIGALPEVATQCPEVSLVIAGPDDGVGEEWRRLAEESGVGDRVRFEGFLDDRDLLAAYVAADLFVLPSDWEAFGIVLLEAMACETPCVVADRGGAPEVVVDGETGLVAPYGNQEAWRDAIVRLLTDGAERRRMGTVGKERALSEFSWVSIVDRIEEVYTEVLGAS